MERLAARFAAGRLWRVAARVPVRRALLDAGMGGDGVGGDGSGEGAVRAASPVLPAKFGWLVWQVGWQAAGFGGQLRAVLERPEMVALLEASPQAGRILRPICRMLAVETSLLRLRPVVAAVPVVAVTGFVAGGACKTRKRVRAVVEPWRIPLPRGVLAAARRQGFGRIPPAKG